MKLSLFCIGAASALFCLSAVNGQGFSIVSTTSSQVSLSQDAEYSCEFFNLWTSARHPNEYPSDAHWSPPVMASHNSGYQMWAPGQLASTGVERVAETGATSNLVNEIDSSSDTGNFVIGSVMFNRDDQQQTLSNLIVDSALPLISSIAMIAPTPDWFSGFYDFDPRDSSTNTWFGEFIIETYPWDAGTETGDFYSTSNDAEPVNIPIFRLDEETVPQSTGVFLNQDGTTVLPVARWHCALLTEAKPQDCKKGRARCASNDECCSDFCIPLGEFSECQAEKEEREDSINRDDFKLSETDRRHKQGRTSRSRGNVRGLK